MDEQELVKRLQRGDAAAPHLLYTRYVRYLTAVCARYITNDEDVRDILQDSFLRIFSSFPTFVYRGEGSLRAWLTRIVVNEALKWLRDSHICWQDIDGINDIPDDEPDTTGVPTELIYRLIRALPDGYRTVFNLYVIEGKSHKEIADLLHITESTSASQLHRAKALLAKWIKQHPANNAL